MDEELVGFRRRLEARMGELSKSQQSIAIYLLGSFDEAAFLSAADLARRLKISEATVVRFAKSVGYRGYPELKHQLQELYRGQVTPAVRLQHKLVELSGSKGHILSKLLAMEIQYLAEAERSVATADFDRAVEIVLHGRRVFVRGGGPSAILADLLELRLRRFGIDAIAISESGRDMVEKLQLLRPEDAVVITGFHHKSIELVATVEHAHRVGCHSVLLTDTLGAAFRDKVDVVLAARRGPVSTFHSLTVPMAIVNALILAVAMARPQESLAALERMERMRVTYHFELPA